MMMTHSLARLLIFLIIGLQISPENMRGSAGDTGNVARTIVNRLEPGIPADFTTDDSLNSSEIVVLRNENYQLPYDQFDTAKLALLTIGGTDDGSLLKSIRKYRKVDNYIFAAEGNFEDAATMAMAIKRKYNKLIISVGDNNGSAANNYGITDASVSLVHQLQEEMRTTTLVFGNPRALVNFEHSPALVTAVSDDSLTLARTGDLLFHAFDPGGHLQVSVSKSFPMNAGFTSYQYNKANVPYANPDEVGVNKELLGTIDSIAQDGIAHGAFPGCTIIGMRNGKIFYQKAFGTLSYDDNTPVDVNTIYDMASCTKTFATTIATMKLYDEGKLKLTGTLGEYLPWLRNTDKAKLTIKDVMLHEAGFIPDFPINDLLLSPGNLPDPEIFHLTRDHEYSIHVAENMYMRKDYLDTLKAKIRNSRLGSKNYVYSDIDFQLMGYIVEEISGLLLDEYVKRTFYDKIGMVSTGFLPRERYALNQIAPTECEKEFRLQCLHGDVHDPRAALTGGVAGHAGLFSNTYDIAALLSMMLNNGVFDGKSYLKPATIRLFTSYQSKISRRGIGFDKPSKDQSVNKRYPYPSKYASAETFGHTGYTGTRVWADPKYDFAYIFLSNRVNPDGGSNLKLSTMEISGKIQDAFYTAMGVGK